MRRYEKNPANYPQTRFDLVKEAVISGGVATLLVVAAVLLFGVPYVKPLTIKNVATTQPVLFLRTAAGELADTSAIARYGPPYNNGTGSLQAIGAFHPQTLLGVTQPINPAQVDVLKPLSMAAPLDPQIKAPLAAWHAASHAHQQAWVKAYLGTLANASVQGSSVVVPQAADGPVPTMLSTLVSQWNLIFGSSKARFRMIFDARSASRRWLRCTSVAKRVRKRPSSSAESPPPITATRRLR